MFRFDMIDGETWGQVSSSYPKWYTEETEPNDALGYTWLPGTYRRRAL
jgi:hypothetical protein